MSPLSIVKAGYAAYQARDLPGVFALLSPEIEIVQTSLLPWGGHFRGHDGAGAFFGALARHTEGGPRPERFIEAGEDVVAIGRLVGTVRATGTPYDLAIVHRWTVRDGLIVRFEAFIDTPGMLSALGG